MSSNLKAFRLKFIIKLIGDALIFFYGIIKILRSGIMPNSIFIIPMESEAEL